MSDKRTSTFSGPIWFEIPVDLHDMLRQLLQFLAASDGARGKLMCGQKQCCPVLLCLSMPVRGVLEKLDVSQGPGDQRATSLVQARVLIAQAKQAWMGTTFQSASAYEESRCCVDDALRVLDDRCRATVCSLAEQVGTQVDVDMKSLAALTRAEPLSALFSDEHNNFESLKATAKSAFKNPDAMKGFVLAHRALKDSFRVYSAVYGKFDKVQDALFPEAIARADRAYDTMTALQVLVRELKPGEDLTKLASLCYRTVCPENLCQVLRHALQDEMSKPALAQLEAPALPT